MTARDDGRPRASRRDRWLAWAKEVFKVVLGAASMAVAVLPAYFDLRARVTVLEERLKLENPAVVGLGRDVVHLETQVKELKVIAWNARCAVQEQVYDATLLDCVDAPSP